MTFGILAACLAILAAAPAVALDGNPEEGARQFALNCAGCHGANAAGDGPMTDILSIAPPDLTMLATEDGFPMADVVRRIDGRDLLGHGGPMPLFGAILQDKSAVVDDAYGNPVFTSQPVLDIATWLSTIQR